MSTTKIIISNNKHFKEFKMNSNVGMVVMKKGDRNKIISVNKAYFSH